MGKSDPYVVNYYFKTPKMCISVQLLQKALHAYIIMYIPTLITVPYWISK